MPSLLEPTPSFSVAASNNKREDWVLTSARCERCQMRGRRRCGAAQIAQMYHYVEPVGAGHAYCMDLVLPEVSPQGIGCGACDTCGTDASDWKNELTSIR